MLQITGQTPAAQAQLELLNYKGEPLSLSHPLIVAIRAWLPAPQIGDVITAAQKGYAGEAAGDALSKVAAKCDLYWSKGKFSVV